MKNYRNAFLITVVANLFLVAILATLWWKSHRREPRIQTAEAHQGVRETHDSNSVLAAASQTETPLAPIQIPAERLQSIGVEFGVVARKSVQEEIRTTGSVAVDETRLSYVQSRIAGHIEKVFADATYEYVRSGQPLFTIHSPELIAAEREYLLAKQNAKALAESAVPGVASGGASLFEAAKERLAQWNIPPREIARLESTGEPAHALEFASPVSGYITERNALPNMMVQPDTRLYTVADLSVVWVIAQVFQNDLGRARIGAPASLSVDAYPGRIFHGRVDFVYPEIDMATRTARVRLVFENPKLTLTPGMYVNVTLSVPLGQQLVIPASGVLHSGMRQIVFLDRGAGHLEPREVELGSQAGDEYIVLKGLKAGERIVTSANFLVDSESQLQAAIGSFSPPSPGAGAAEGVPAAQPATQMDFTTEPAPPHKGTNVYRVRLKTAGGSPLGGATVNVRSYMPAMPGMGMPAMKMATALKEKGNGVYEGEARLESGGTWQITVSASKNGAVLATKQLSVVAEGGM